MATPTQPPGEADRLSALLSYRLLDTPAESAFDDLTGLAAQLCDTPIALISLVDTRRVWFKASTGLVIHETPRDVAFCSHAILQSGAFVIPDASADPRFADNELVVNAPRVRAYAGAPIVTADGHAIGALSVMDTAPRAFTSAQLDALTALSRQAMAQFEMRRQARALCESETRLRMVTDNARVGLVMIDREHRYVFANPDYATILGLETPNIVGQRIEDVLPTLYDAQIRHRLDRAFAGERVAFELRKMDNTIDAHFAVRYEPTAPSPITGRVEQVVVVISEITAHKEELEAAGRLGAIVESSNDAIIGKDLDGHITSWNRAAETLFGYPAQEIIGQSIRLLIPDDRLAEEDRILAQITRGEVIQHLETKRRRRDGRLVDVSITSSPIRDVLGRVVGASKVARDITERKRAEAQLLEREEQLRLYAEHSPLAVAMFDRDMRYLVASRRWIEDFRLGQTPIIGRSHYDVFPEIPESWREVHRRCLAGAIEKDDEAAFLRADGRIDWIRWEIRPWRQPDGRIGGIIIFSEDISAKKEGENALIASEGRYRALFDHAPDGILIADSNYKYLDANPNICKMLGYARHELIGRTGTDIIVPEESSLVTGARLDLAASAAYRHEWQMRRKDGSVFSADVIATTMPDGNRLAMIRDVTEKNRANAALRAADDRMRFALQNADVGIWDADYTTGVVQWSDIAERHHGLAPGTFGGTFEAFMACVHPEDRAGIDRTVATAVSAGSDFRFEYRAAHPDGSIRRLAGAGRVHVGSAGEPVRGVGITLDVTERYALEAQYQQAQKMEAVGRLAGGVAHDFNNMLTAILGYCELVLERLAPDEPLRSDVMQIQKAGTSAAGITRQLLAFSRKQIIEPRRLDLNAVVTNVKAMLGRLIGEDVRIVVELSPTPVVVWADAGQMEQILLNLAVNARDAMPHGGTLTIATAPVTLDEHYVAKHFAVTPGDYVALAVADTGTGMTADVREHLFEPFFTTKELGKGTGLGLATVHGIATQCGGNINVYSELGRGSTFTIHFPRLDEADAIAPPPIVTAPRNAVETVLLVEDEDDLRLLIRRLLERQGYKTLVAANAEEALALFRENDTVDVLLTDVVMPGASGPQLTRQLLEQRPSLKVIFMSGYTEEAIVHHGVIQPGVTFLHKPFTLESLGRKLRDVLTDR